MYIILFGHVKQSFHKNYAFLPTIKPGTFSSEKNLAFYRVLEELSYLFSTTVDWEPRGLLLTFAKWIGRWEETFHNYLHCR